MSVSVSSAPTAAPRRVTVVAPHTRVDVSLPLEATVAELVPQLAALVGLDAEDADAASNGWVLSRLDGEQLDAARTVVTSRIRDGELLYLSPRSAALPPPVFDDVIEAIADASGRGGRQWLPRHTRTAGLVVAAALLVAGTVPLAQAGPPWGSPFTIAFSAALALVLVAAIVSRVLGASGPAALVVAAATPYGFLAGTWLLLDDGSGWRDWRPGQVAVGLALTLLVLVAGAAGVGDRLPAFVAPIVGSAGILAMMVAVMVTGAAPGSAAVVTLGLVLVALPLTTTLALRLGRLPAPEVPADAAAFRRSEPSTAGPAIRDNTRLAGQYGAALVAGVCVIAVTAAVVVLRLGDGWARAAVACVSLALLLRARQPARLPQRATLIATGVAGLLATVLVWADDWSPAAQIRLVVLTGLAALGVLVYALRMAGRTASPYWGRSFDVLEFLAMAAVAPLAAAALDLYARVRGFGG